MTTVVLLPTQEDAMSLQPSPGDWDPLYSDDQLLDDNNGDAAVAVAAAAHGVGSSNAPAASGPGRPALHLRGSSFGFGVPNMLQPTVSDDMARMMSSDQGMRSSDEDIEDLDGQPPLLIGQRSNDPHMSRRSDLIMMTHEDAELALTLEPTWSYNQQPAVGYPPVSGNVAGFATATAPTASGASPAVQRFGATATGVNAATIGFGAGVGGRGRASGHSQGSLQPGNSLNPAGSSNNTMSGFGSTLDLTATAGGYDGQLSSTSGSSSFNWSSQNQGPLAAGFGTPGSSATAGDGATASYSSWGGASGGGLVPQRLVTHGFGGTVSNGGNAFVNDYGGALHATFDARGLTAGYQQPGLNLSKSVSALNEGVNTKLLGVENGGGNMHGWDEGALLDDATAQHQQHQHQQQQMSSREQQVCSRVHE